MVPVLFVAYSSNYKNDLRFDCYDIERNALTIKNTLPAIYHPPCRTWGRLYKLANWCPGEHLLAVWSILRVWRYGGVLEHPAGSKLWRLMGLPIPGSGYDNRGGFSISLNMSWFGYPATKNTWVYVKGCSIGDVPSLPLSFDVVTHCVSSTSKSSGLKELSKVKRSETPMAMCDWLYAIVSCM